MLWSGSKIYLTIKETWHVLCVNFLVVNEYDVHLSFHCIKLNKDRPRSTEIIRKYELISDVSYQNVTQPQKSIFHKTKEIMQNSPETAFVWFFVILCCSPLLPVRIISLEWNLKLKPCALQNSHTFWDISIIFGMGYIRSRQIATCNSDSVLPC